MSKPSIRIKGFTDDWEQRKLGDVAKFRQGIQVDLEKQYTEFADGRERFIRIVDYTQGTDDIRYIDEVESANHVDVDDVVVVRYGATAGFVGHGITGVIANNMFTINPSDSINKDFLYTFMKQEKMYESLNSSNGSSAMPAINFGIMSNIRISYPSIEEQTRIGDYFSNLDNLITLHQRKCDDTKQLKKFMLSKMFPKNGLKRPEIRFEGFTDDWEQRKLGELSEKVSRKAPIDSEAPVMMISSLAGFINQSEKYSNDNAGKSLAHYTLLKKGEMAYNHGYSKARNFGSCFDLKCEEARIPFVYHSFAMPSDDTNFYAHYLNCGLFDYELKKRVSSTARMDGLLNISYDSYMTIEVGHPSLDEQHKIGDFLSTLDNLITLHQRKCDTLKELKRYMLHNMFA